MFDDGRGSLTQNRIDVRLVQKDGDLNKPVGGPDPQLLLLPSAGRRAFLDPEDRPASTSHHMAKLGFSLSQIGHVLSLPTFSPKPKGPPH